jgi:hypothetical protein
LPSVVRDSFQRASVYDLMLIARACASQITHFYSYKPNGVNGHRHWFDEETSQRYNQGNVGIRPQDSIELHELLPPSHDELRDAMCVIFTGHAQKPTRETVKRPSGHPRTLLITRRANDLAFFAQMNTIRRKQFCA